MNKLSANKYRLYSTLLSLCLIMCPGCGNNHTRTIIEVSNAEQFREAVLNAVPGTVIEVADGDYSFDDTPLQVNLKGSKEQPVVIRAKNRGKAVFTGEYSMLLEDCSFVTVEGFILHNRALKHALPDVSSTDTWIEAMRDEMPYHGSLLVLNCDNCRLTRLDIALEEHEGFSPEMLRDRLPRMHWVNLSGGSHNSVDHCRFSGKKNSGVYIEIGPQERYFLIDRNHFDGRPPGNFNGFETIRCNPGGLNSMYGTIKYNLFENCDGEGEIISVKSSVLRISHNTFRDCRGRVVVRMGNRGTIDNNYFLNPSGKSGVGGVRIHGNDCNVLNNYFGDLSATGLMTLWGDYDRPDFTDEGEGFFAWDLGAKAYSYRQARRAHIAFNTWANCAEFLNLNSRNSRELADQNLPPRDWTFLNNLIVCRDMPCIRGEGEMGFRWIGNIFWNPDGLCDIGREMSEGRGRVIDPKLERSADGLWRLTAGSPAIDTNRSWYYPAEIIPEFMVDMDGQPRDLEVKVTEPQVQSEFKFDVGADEYSDAPVTNKPLTAIDVGPEAI